MKKSMGGESRNRSNKKRKNTEQQEPVRENREAASGVKNLNDNRKPVSPTADEQHDSAVMKPSEEVSRAGAKPGKKKPKLVFPFGNYKNYYGYRIGQDLGEDPRISAFKKEWFEGRDCLDIGCNSGIITVHTAKKYHCRSILGIDIDSSLVEAAYWYLRKIVKMESSKKKNAKDSCVKVGEDANGSDSCTTALSTSEASQVSSPCSPAQRDLSDVVSFRKENFVRSNFYHDKHYDTILCLSVTKWIHLNWGDDGLIALFTKMWKLLRPGGILVLEPQPWDSYEKNRKVSETTNMNYYSIKLHPQHFQEILLDKVGFRKVEDITCGLHDTKMGFDRPIFVFHK